MKKGMLIACGILMSCSIQKIYGQQEKVYITNVGKVADVKDTVIINLKDADKIIVIGKSMKVLSAYNKGDSLKTLFLSDWDKAVANQSASVESKHVHYFVHTSGKRRLKAENQDYMEPAIDVANEITRLNLDLPPYQYIIHDLVSDVEIQVYIKDPATLKNELGSVSLNEALISIAADKREMKRNYEIEVIMNNGGYKQVGSRGVHTDAIEVAPTLGVGLIGNTVAPVLGGDIMLRFNNKYGEGKYKVAVGLTAFPFVQSAEGKVSGVSFVTSYDLRLAFNVTDRSRKNSNWLGIQGGIMKSTDISSFDGAYKVGLLYEGGGPFNYSFDYIRERGGNPIYGLTLKLPF